MYCECFPPSCLSWNIFIPNKCVFTLDVAWGSHSLPHTLKGATEIPDDKQVDLQGFPWGLPQLWWQCYQFSFKRWGWKHKYLQQLPWWSWGERVVPQPIHTYTYFFYAVMFYRGKGFYTINTVQKNLSYIWQSVLLIVEFSKLRRWGKDGV